MRDHGYDNELAYLKVLHDQLGMDRPTNEQLKKLGQKVNFYKGFRKYLRNFAVAKVCSPPSTPPTGHYR